MKDFKTRFTGSTLPLNFDDIDDDLWDFMLETSAPRELRLWMTASIKPQVDTIEAMEALVDALDLSILSRDPDY